MTNSGVSHEAAQTDANMQHVPKRPTFISVLGEVFITLAAVLALFIVWQNWWTDAVNERVVKQERTAVLNEWGTTMDSDGIVGPVAPSKVSPPASSAPSEVPQDNVQPNVFHPSASRTNTENHVGGLSAESAPTAPASPSASIGRVFRGGGTHARAVHFTHPWLADVQAGSQQGIALGRLPLPMPKPTPAAREKNSKRSQRPSTSGHSKLKQPKKIATIGFIYAPALKKKRLWAIPIVTGTSDKALARGVGHYVGSAGFGGIGNAAVAGHRTTHGAPFRYINTFKRGDHVVIRTRNWWFIYVLDRSTIVRPKEHWVLKARPFKAKFGRLLTMTSCHPLHSASRRFVWWGHLLRKLPATGAPPVELKLRR